MPRPQPRRSNPIQAAIETWFASLPVTDPAVEESWRSNLLSTAPKRYTIYEPLALLPAGSFTNPAWLAVLQSHGEKTCSLLWSLILKELSKDGRGTVTHLAINEGIPLRKDGDGEEENVRRSPSGLRMLSGDFGPSDVRGEQPTAMEFEDALWVGTKQNGIHQTWAPRWTMFSRGNIKEKARLLDFGSRRAKDCWAVDLYAGIGYFTFSYASLGMRVLCWEINPWSVEGLRRGAAANRWSIKVIQGDDLTQPLEHHLAGHEQIIVFLESNEEALRRVKELQGMGLAHVIEHINCGFLPTSAPIWKPALEIAHLSSGDKTWLHLHENVGVHDIESRRQAVQVKFDEWCAAEGSARIPVAGHVEQVKTFAPGVWHCVFDVHITRSNIT